MQLIIPLFILTLLWVSTTLLSRLYIQHELSLPLSDILTQLALIKGLLWDWLLAGICLTPLIFFKHRIGYFLIQTLFICLFLVLTADTFYFYYTSTHIEPVLFENLNFFAIRVFIDFNTIGYLGLVLLIILGIFWWLKRYVSLSSINQKERWFILGNIVFTSGLLFILHQPYFLPVVPEQPTTGLTKNIEENRIRHRQLLETSALINFCYSLYLTVQHQMNPQVVKHFQPYSATEQAYLENLGLLKTTVPPVNDRITPYQTIVLIVLESMHRDYLHTYNAAVPPETTPFLDNLIARYPHLDNYFTSATPSTHGLNAMFKSQLDLRSDFNLTHREESLFSVLQEQAEMTGFFVRSVIGQFDDDYLRYPRLFHMNHFIAAEELSNRYPPPNLYAQLQGWGYDDTTLYTEGLRILRAQKGHPTFLVLKTIDSHAPHVCHYDYEELPDAIRKHPNYSLLCTVYGADRALAAFFQAIEKAGLLDKQHLFVVTADHAPYMGPEHRPLLEPRNYPLLGRIPLIFVSGDLTPWQPLKYEQFASQIDLTPTLLDVMGITLPKEFLGTSLLRSRDPEFALGFYRSQVGEQLFYTRANEAFIANLSESVGNSTLLEEQIVALKKWFENRHIARSPE